MQWFLNEASAIIKEFQMWFPIVGHSFIPVDTVFRNLEREFWKIDVIEKPEIYMYLMKKHKTVTCMEGENCPLRDWKTYGDGQIKELENWHFRFKKARKTKPRTKMCA